jgi:glycosyltransferase involved in cell wall biosynthesis
MNLNPVVRIYQFLFNWITSRLFCAKIIAVSESVKKDIIRQGSRANKTIVVYNGIDLLEDIRCEKGPIKIREEFGLRANQRIIGQVGRLGVDKGQHILIEASQKVIKDNPDVVFVIVGEDLTKERDHKKRLERLAGDLGLRKQIIFTGYRLDIMDLMHAFDIFVLPSTFKEGLAIVILEAMAAKKPVITTIVGGNPEIVIDGETGTLVPPEDPDKLAEAIVYHLNHPEISKQMGEKGYERVKKYFSLTQMLDKVMNVYKEVS